MMLFIYNLLLNLYFIVTLPYYAIQMARRERYRAGLKQRLGIYPVSLWSKLQQRKRIWIHAVSVGEVLAIIPLLKLLQEELPDWSIVLSTVTLTGQRIAREKVGGNAVVVYYPLDFRFAVRRALQIISPSVIILVETEIWPNFISAASGRNIPIAIVNGRISDRSYRRYLCGRFLLKKLLGKVELFCMQTELDKERIRSIGAPPEKIKVTGNMKFDCPIKPSDKGEDVKIAASLGIKPQQKIIVAGSTHRGEEEIMLNIFRKVKKKHDETVLIIAPRHPERAEEVKSLADSMGERAILKSQLKASGTLHPNSVLIVDTIGQLLRIYRCATMVFVGKSLVEGGGQNIIEPASLGKPVLFGPNMQNFREAAELLLKNGGAIQVRDETELQERLIYLLENSEEREKIGLRAASIMARSRGATELNLRLIRELLI